MRSVALAGIAVLLLSACDRAVPIVETDLLVRVEVGSRQVELGQAFPITVTRIWEKDLEPSEWDDAALSPLIVRLESTARREDDRRVEETWVYRGYAFTLKDVRIPPVLFAARPRAGGQGRIVKTDALRLRVRRALDPEAPGDPELPGGLRSDGRNGALWILGAGSLLLALGGLVLVRTRRLPPELVSDAEEATETPAASALAALARIRARSPEADDVSEAADVLRDYVEEALGVPTRRRTTEEVLAAPSLEEAEDLAVVLRAGDRVKYATWQPEVGERLSVLDAAQRFVETVGGPVA